jgi:hypothetical protein
MAKDTVDVTPVVDAPKADTCTDCTGYCQVCGATKAAE